MKTHRPYLLASVVVLGAITITRAQPALAQPDLADSPHTHKGAYLQLTPGISAIATGTKLADDTEVTLSGAGGAFGLGAGYAVAENWLLGIEAAGTNVFGPTLKNGGMEVQSKDSVKWNTYYVGVAFAHYFMPIDLRVGGSLGALQMSLDLPDMPMVKSKTGGVAKLAVAKEWWVSDHWGLGVALESALGVVPDDKPADNGWGVFGVNLALSATYN